MHLTKPLFFGLAAVVAALGLLAPLRQDPGVQSSPFAGTVVTTTTQTQVVACGQGDGAIGRKTLVVENASGSDGVITVTGELRTTTDGNDFTSGILAVSGLATNSISSDTSPGTESAGRFCAISAVSASTSTITVTLRRE